MLGEARFSTKSLALGVLFGAFYGLLRLVSLFPVIGLPGRFFSAADVAAPILGIILDPVVAGVAVTVGTYLAIGVTGTTLFYGLDFVPALLNVLAVGLMIRGRRGAAVALYASLLALFVFHPGAQGFEVVEVSVLEGGLLVPYAWLHVLCLLLLLSPLERRAVSWTLDLSSARATLGIALLCLAGTTLQHLTGSLLFLSILGLPTPTLTTFFQATFVVYPIERLTIVMLATAVGSVALKPLRNSGFLPREFARAR